MRGFALEVHAEFLHDVNRSEILGLRDGDDALQVRSFEAVAHCFACRFGGETLSPAGSCQPPADFYLWSFSQRLQAAESDQFLRVLIDQPPKAEAAGFEAGNLPRYKIANAFVGPGLAVRNVAHHFGILSDRLQLQPVV